MVAQRCFLPGDDLQSWSACLFSQERGASAQAHSMHDAAGSKRVDLEAEGEDTGKKSALMAAAVALGSGFLAFAIEQVCTTCCRRAVAGGDCGASAGVWCSWAG